ncbi:MAG: M20/M25/M40 family metallo-hydrolase [Deltaproteobacteria bacterium]|nr:M20/M25/M40 family metallo-hydrolase [Deltaproteobacteria bacterium]
MEKTTKTETNDEASIRPQRLKTLLRHLIDIYSPTGKEEEIIGYLRGYLKKHGLPVEVQNVDDGRDNLIVMPPGRDIQVVLMGHVDTVAAYDLDDYEWREDGDSVYGLGAADMKSGCAALVEAYISAWEHVEEPFPAALALLIGEEEDGDGARAFIEDYHVPWVVIGEPTALKPCLSHYGYMEIQIAIQGKRRHASLATRDKNPVESMLRLLLSLSEYVSKRRPELVYNIRDIYSPPGGFVVPDYCEVWIDAHVPPDAPIGEITVELEEMVERYTGESPSLDIALRFTTIHGGYDIPPKGAFVETIKDIYQSNSLEWAPQAFRSHSDANIFWEAGIKPIIIGPGQLEQAHAPEESVSFDQVCRAAHLYFDLIRSLRSD